MKENLSTSVSITSTYAGESAGKYIMAMLLANKTLGQDLITVKPNIKYKQVVKKMATSGLIAASTCDFTDTGTVTLTERIIEPVELQVNMEICKSPFIKDWEAISMGYSNFDVLPANFTDYLIGNITASIGAELETAIWQYGTSLSGFTTLFKSDATVLDVSGTTITSANVQAELTKVVEKIATTNVYGAVEKPRIYVATNVYVAYMISLGGFGASGLGANGYNNQGPTNVQSAPMFFGGLEVVEAPGLKSSEMVVSQPSNLWFGTGILNDTNTVKVLDMAELDGSDNVRFIAKWSAGVQYGIGSEIVYYWIY